MAKIDLLTAAKVKSLKAPGDYLDGRGLYLQVRSESSKSWLLKFSMNKKSREMGLGSAFDFALSDARDMRDRYRKLIKTGIDPIEHRKAEEAASRRREGQGRDLQGCGNPLHRSESDWLEKSQTRRPVGSDP